MKPEYKTAGGIFGLVVLGGVVSASVFVVFGSRLAIYSLFGLVPLLAVAGFVFVRTTVADTGSGQKRIREQRAREVANDFGAVFDRFRSMRATYPELVSESDVPFDRVIGRMEEEGFDVDRESGTADLGRFASPDVGALASIGNDVEELSEALDEAFVEGVRGEIRRLNGQLERLDGVIGPDVHEDPETVTKAAGEEGTGQSWWRTLGSRLEEYREHVRSETERAAEALRSDARNAGDVEMSTVEEQLSGVSSDDVETAVGSVLSARDTFRRAASGSFDEHRRELLALADAVRSADVLGRVSDDRSAAFERAVDDVEALDDAVEVSELRRSGRELRSTCTAMVTDLESELDGCLSTLESASVPEDYYERPAAADAGYGEELSGLDDSAAYRSTWMGAADALTDALDALERKTRVARMYDDIETRIETELRRSGEVRAADIPVKRDEEQFMGLYARTHDVEFDPTEPSLTAAGSAETHTVTANVRFADGGAERSARVDLDGETHSDHAEVTTYLAETVTFEEVPFGEYTVRAVPATDGNEPAEASVTVDADVSVDLEMPDVTLRERLCEGLDDVDRHVSEMSDRFEQRFEASGYLDGSMSFPVSEEYVPCLLATWAAENGYGVTETRGEGVVVYSADLVAAELRKVAEHNLEPDESIDYGGLRERFLSAPVPDAVVREVAASVSGLQPTDEGVHRPTEGE